MEVSDTEYSGAVYSDFCGVACRRHDCTAVCINYCQRSVWLCVPYFLSFCACAQALPLKVCRSWMTIWIVQLTLWKAYWYVEKDCDGATFVVVEIRNNHLG